MFFSVCSPRSTNVSLHPVAHLPPGVLRDVNPARLGDALDPRRDVDAVAHQVAVGLLDDVSEMNADPVLDALVRRDAGIALDHAVLNFDRAAQRIDHAAELDDQPIAGALDHPAVVGGDRRVGEVAAQSAQACEHALLVRPGETAEADDVGGKDGGELAGFFHGALGDAGTIAQDCLGAAILTRRDRRVRQRSQKREAGGS